MNEEQEGGPARAVDWTARDVVWGLGTVVAWTLFLLVALAIAGFFLAASGLPLTSIALAGLFLTEGVLFAVAWAWSVRKYRLGLGALGWRAPFRRNAPVLAGLVLVLGFLSNFLYAAVISLLQFVFHTSALAPPGPPEFFVQGGLTVLASALLSVVAAPVAEETFFRGFVFAGLVSRFGVRRAAALSAFIFALGHLDPRVLAPIFVLGLLLAWLYWRTRTLWAPLLVHAAYNGVTLLASRVIAN